MKDRIRKFLASGLKASEVAELVGCSPSYISQLLKDPDYKASVEELMLVAPASEEDKIEKKYDAVEMRILNQMSEAVVGAELPHLSSALREISKARDTRLKQRNPLLSPERNMGNVQIVQVMLPSHAISPTPQLTLNAKSEVIAIDNRPLAPMTSAGVKTMFDSLIPSKQEVQNVSTDSISAELISQTASGQTIQAEF